LVAAATPNHLPLPATTHVGAVRLQVADLRRSVDYYSTVIGLRVIEHDDNAVALGAHDSNTRLVFLQEKNGIQPAPARGAYGLYHFAILVPNRPALGRFATHVGRLGVRVGMADHWVSEALYLTDPDGLGIEVYADRPRDRWQYRGGELAMATEPLDIGSVMAAADQQPWTGAPAGTAIGHIHLHVGAIEPAAAFYHSALGFDKTVWSYPGALFMSAGGYHHHLGTNTWSRGPSATDDQARLLEWELVVPEIADLGAIGRRMRSAGYDARETERGWLAADPWGTRLRIISA
jgi:catechol 2,3-dioxygenase